MTTLSLTLALILGGCFGSSSESKPETPTEQQASKKSPAGKAKKARGANAAKAKTKTKTKVKAPVIRTGRFRIPLAKLADDDVAGLKDAVMAAWDKTGGATKSDKKKDDAEAIDNTSFPKPWKCRRTTVWDVAAKDGATTPQVRLFERLPDPSCDQTEDKIERWELSLRYAFDDKPKTRDGGGEFRYLMSGLDLDLAADAWDESYSHVFRRDSGKLEVAFPHDDAWLGEQLPEGTTLTEKKAVLNSERWALAKIDVAGEQITVEVERWACRDGDAFASAEILFRTNKRQPGHTTTTPKNVLVTEKIRAFADALTAELGDRVGGEGNVTAAGLTCSKS
jgi:hypothetical protein